MSKRLKNYPDPVLVVDKYGADALRLYLINSPVVRGQELRFVEAGVKDVVKDVFLPWFNAYRFFTQSVLHYEKGHKEAFVPDSKITHDSQNVMDKWILAALQSLLTFVKEEMAGESLPHIFVFWLLLLTGCIIHTYSLSPLHCGPQARWLHWPTHELVHPLQQKTLEGQRWRRKLSLSSQRAFRGPLQPYQSDGMCLLPFSPSDNELTAYLFQSPFTPFFTEYLYKNLRNVLPESEREDSTLLS